jgi:hypothetical protein
MSANRAARRRAKRAGPAPQLLGGDQATIKLQNPVAEHFQAFVIGNAVQCQRIPPHAYGEKCDSAACAVVVEKDSAAGQHLVLCGAGPSLAETAAEWCPQGDQVWGCNSAMTWLYDHNHRPTHGFTVDQTAHMLEEWASVPDVEYLIASTVHPHLSEYLVARGRRTRFFHNYVGIKGDPVTYDGETMGFEDWMYAALFPTTVRAGSGLNSVNRAIDVALFMGFGKITVLGADCAIRFTRPQPKDAPIGSPAYRQWLEEETTMHADGGHAMASGATQITMQGEVDGRLWLTKPDMIVSAVWLEKTRQRHRDTITLVGDTLPVALRDKPDEYLRRLPTMVDSHGEPLAFG